MLLRVRLLYCLLLPLLQRAHLDPPASPRRMLWQGLPYASLFVGLVFALLRLQRPSQSQEAPSPLSLEWHAMAWHAGATLAYAPKLGGHWGCPWLRSPGTLCLLAAGRGDIEYGDLKDEGLYLYLDEDEPPEVLGGPARCQDTYQDWISLYCWAPFHATLMAIPESSRCHWDQIGRLASHRPLCSIYSELSGCTQLLAQLLSCPWPSTVLDAFFLQVHAEYFTNCTGGVPPRLGGLPPGMAMAVAVGLSCLVPLAAALTLRRARKGAQPPAGSSLAPACPHACKWPQAAPFPPSTGN
ncbi:uncharacterized protein LOC135317354 isoform X3 [Phalacrocorax carbo]|uniref:uncharacterized protein LOC135317354 isoform X3 n=1 Tax=Phalacrocorax carbo TaxID=9209 RepID=UPI00311A2315